MSVPHQFGGAWTQEKLDILERYLVAYSTVMKRQYSFTTHYVDAFAGTGSRQSPASTRTHAGATLFEDENDAQDADLYQRGSAQVALEIEQPFDRYVFVDTNPEFTAELENLRVRYPQRSIRVATEEANHFLVRWSQELAPRDRAVVFLDPYGMSVNWSTIEALAATRKIDLWILFPIGVAVNRLLTRKQPPPKSWADALTRFFGDPEWEGRFYRPNMQPSLFGDDAALSKEADFEAIGDYFIERLMTIFAGVSSEYKTLRNSRNSPLYLLCFAASNPAGAPIAIRIANHLLRS
jgi:three-Cys-motif partner protein